MVVYAAESMSVADPYNEQHRKQMEEWGYKRREVPPMPEFK